MRRMWSRFRAYLSHGLRPERDVLGLPGGAPEANPLKVLSQGVAVTQRAQTFYFIQVYDRLRRIEERLVDLDSALRKGGKKRGARKSR